MKKILLILAATTLFAACCPMNEDPNGIYIQSEDCATTDGSYFHTKKFTYKGKHYIGIKFSTGDCSWGGIIEDPEYSSEESYEL